MRKLFTLLTFMLLTLQGFSQWTEQTSSTTHELISVFFVNNTHGWCIGYNGSDEILLRTTDGGNTWNPQNFVSTNFCTSVFFVDQNHGWITESKGKLFATTDGGSTWTSQTLNNNKYLHQVVFTDLNKGWVVGQDGKIWHTTDGGLNWLPQTSGTTQRLLRIFFLDSLNGWAAGWGGIILRTTNGGQNWTTLTTNTTKDVMGIWFNNTTEGWASATNFMGSDAVVLHTTDGGNTWSAQFNPQTYLTQLQFVNADTGFVVGWDGHIFSTSDGGDSWIPENSGVSMPLHSLCFTDASHGWACGYNGTILQYYNPGSSSGIGQQTMPAHDEIHIVYSTDGACISLMGNQHQPGITSLKLYDAMGRLVDNIDEQFRQAGTFSVSIDAGKLSPGMYFASFITATGRHTAKVTVR